MQRETPYETIYLLRRKRHKREAFQEYLVDPYDPRGGSFMGPCRTKDVRDIDHAAQLYIECGDEIPLHFHFHLQQAAEILGYKHPVKGTREWWYRFYLRLVAFAHLNPETEAQMHRRHQDNEETWREREA